QLKPSKILKLNLSNNYTLIKVQDSFIEDTEYSAEYVPNLTRYTGLQINLDQKDLGNQIIIEGNLWVLEGKLIRISDREPLAGERTILSVKPGVKAAIENNISEYESYYFFPFNYEVTIYPKKYPSNYKIYPKMYQPLTVKMDKSTTLINWMYHVAKAYRDVETSFLDEEMEWLSSSGYPLDREIEEYQAIKSLLARVLDLYQKEEYGPALGGASISAKRIDSLKLWLSNPKTLAIMASVGICLFTYGLASMLSIFIFEEPSESKIRLVSKVLIFSLFMLMFSLTNPSLKITYAIIINSKSIDLPISLLGCFIIGSITYFFIELILIKKTPITDLALQMGVRSLKRRLSRTMLTLLTITIIVSSAMVFVNISGSRATRVKDSWKGTNIPGVLIKPDIGFVVLSEYDVNWTRMQDWCKDLDFTEKIRDVEYLGDAQIVRYGFLLFGEQTLRVSIIGIDPIFAEKYYNLSKYLRGPWRDFSDGKAVAFLPTTLIGTLHVPTNEYVTLTVEEYLVDGIMLLDKRKLGEFRVIGNFEPLVLSNLTKIDKSPLFEDPSILVLVPVKTVRDPSIVISEATIIVNEGFDPVNVAEELAYMLGVPTIANKDGLA
ncbi:MAG: hypothetical protein H3Z52_15780, partial [archaeon]|nr:hypothetical protein [archaeon]